MAKSTALSGGRSKSRIAAISTLVLLGVGALGGFYVSRVHSRIAYLEQRNFRILATFAAGIEGRIEDLSSILAGLEKLASKTREPESKAVGDTELKVELERLRGSLRCVEYLELVGTAGARTEMPHQDTNPARLKTTPRSLHLSYQRPNGGEIHADADIDCLLAWLTAPEAFDEILLVNDKRRTVYQSQTSGVRVRSLAAEATDESGSPLNKKGQDTTLAARLTNVDDVEVAGDRFMVFSQPVTLALGETEGEVVRWELVGLVRTQRLIAEALRMHPSNLVKVAFVLLLSALAWPFLKLWTLGDRRALRARDALLCGLSLMMVTSLLTLGAAGWAAYDHVRTETGMELEATADEVIANLEREIAESLGFLRMAARRALHEGPNVNAQGAGRDAAGGTAQAAPESAFDQLPEKRYGGLLEENWVSYVHLDSVFFTAANGEQIFKQSVEKEATPLIQVADRPYFTRARDGLLWNRNGTRFALDSIRSRNTGEPLAVVAAPWKSLLGKGADLKTASQPPLVAMAASRLPSLLHPILPPGRELAVVDESGRVLFHSRSERNLVEDFVRECEWSSRLLAMMHARTGRPFEASYWGSDRQMAVVPIKGLPWHVVVFQDKALLRTANFEALGLSAGLALAQLVLVVVALGALRLAGGPGSLLRLCAGSEVAPCLRLVVVLLLLCVTLARAPTLMTPAGALIAGAAVPFMAVGLGASSLLRRDWRPRRMRWTALAFGLAGSLALGTGLLLTPPDAQGLLRLAPPSVSGRLLLGSPDAQGLLWLVAPVLAAWVVALWRPRPAMRLGRPGLVVTAAGCAALALLSVLPTLVFLRVVFEDRLALEVRRGQLHLARSLAQRDARVKALYSSVPGVNVNGRWHQLLCETRDVHYASFAGTGFELRPQNPAGVPVCTPSECLASCGLPAGEEGGAAFQTRGIAPWSVFALPDDNDLPFVNAQAIQGRLVKAESRDRGLRWRLSRNGQRFVFSYGSEAAPLSQISSKIPRFRLSRSVSAFALFCASAVVAVVLLVLFLRRMLLIDLRRTCATSLSELVYGGPRRMLVVCPPQAELPAEWRDAYVRLDFAACDPAEVALALGSLGAGDQPILVCLDHVEAALPSARKRRSLREVLDRAFARPSARLVAVVRRSPEALLPELRSDADSKRLREIHDGLAVRWAVDPGLPKSFERWIDQLVSWAEELDGKHRAPAHQALLDECSPDAQLQQIGRTLARCLDLPELRAEDVVQRVHEEAADHYRALCGALSEAERLVLCQIADRSIPVTTTRPILERLLAWGLVVRDPALRPMNESFRAFVLARRDRQALRAWQEAGTSDLWRHLRVPFFAVLASAAAFLVLTQPGLFNSAVALASVIAAGVPTLVRAAGAVRQGLSAARGSAGS